MLAGDEAVPDIDDDEELAPTRPASVKNRTLGFLRKLTQQQHFDETGDPTTQPHQSQLVRNEEANIV